MHDDRVLRLVEEAIESGRTPDDVCASCPDLLPAVRQRLREYQSLQVRLDDLLPDRAAAVDDASDGARAPLPVLPGYEILSTLGVGGMGIVYLARHVTLGRYVAVKMLLAGPFARRIERERLLREAKALAALRHPNIVSVHDVGEVEGRPYFTMEYMEGGPLAERLSGQPKAAAEAARITFTIAEAVACAHAQGIVHRDLKPANVLLAADGTLKVSDFGIARSAESGPTLTHTGARLGTPSYMAPEQALGRVREVGPATDVHALGAILYELLTGRPPFRGATPADTERQLLHEDPAAPRLLVPGLPRDVETICLTCLRKEPHRRYATAHALAEDLQRFLRNEPIAARPVGPVERFGKWVRRHPVHTAASAAAIVALGAVLSTVLWTASQRAAIERAVADDLAEVVRLEHASDWRAARNTLERAKTRLGAAAGRHGLAQHAAAIERELDLVDRLAAMRFERAAAQKVHFDQAEWWQRYRGLFADAGLLRDGDTAEAFAARVAASPARSALVGAMDDWYICAHRGEQFAWLVEATRLADPDPAWRDRARNVATLKDLKALAVLADEAVVATQPVTLLLTVAGTLTGDEPESMSLLRRTQAAHPSDFFASLALAEALGAKGDADAIGFYRAALALRPEAGAVHIQLGHELKKRERIDEAIDCFQRAVSLDPNGLTGLSNLALSLLQRGRFAEAAVHAEVAARLDPEPPQIHGVLADALVQLGRYEEAAHSLRRGLERSRNDPKLRPKFERRLADCEARLRAAAEEKR